VELFTDVSVEVATLVVPEGGELPPEEEPTPEGSVPAETPEPVEAPDPAAPEKEE